MNGKKPECLGRGLSGLLMIDWLIGSRWGWLNSLCVSICLSVCLHMCLNRSGVTLRSYSLGVFYLIFLGLRSFVLPLLSMSWSVSHLGEYWEFISRTFLGMDFFFKIGSCRSNVPLWQEHSSVKDPNALSNGKALSLVWMLTACAESINHSFLLDDCCKRPCYLLGQGCLIRPVRNENQAQVRGVKARPRLWQFYCKQSDVLCPYQKQSIVVAAVVLARTQQHLQDMQGTED